MRTQKSGEFELDMSEIMRRRVAALNAEKAAARNVELKEAELARAKSEHKEAKDRSEATEILLKTASKQRPSTRAA